MVGDKRIDKRIDIDEAECGEKQAQKNKHGGKWSSIFFFQSPGEREQENERQWKEILPPGCAANLAAPVNKRQFYRPKKVEEKKPKVPLREQTPLQEPQLEHGD